MMNPSPNGDVVLVQVKDSKDVDAVKAILQARIQYMVGDGNGPGGAWYPEPTEMWENNSRIVTHGNYVMMVADFECDNIVNASTPCFEPDPNLTNRQNGGRRDPRPPFS